MGLLADIHEDLERLAEAIARCRREGVDRLFTLGDIFETGTRFARVTPARYSDSIRLCAFPDVEIAVSDIVR